MLSAIAKFLCQRTQKKFRPDFQESTLFDALSPQFVEAEVPAAAPRHGNTVKGAKSALDQHLLNRYGSRFFIDLDEIPQIVAHIQTHYPEWKDRTVDLAWGAASGRFDVYASNTTPSQHILWNDLPRGPHDDILYALRPHRFGFCPRMALAALFDNESLYDSLHHLLTSWLQQTASAERPLGYRSHLVAVYRSIALTWTLAFLSVHPAQTRALRFDIMRIILCDTQFVARQLGHSYPNNHLLADGFFLWYIGTLFPEFQKAEEWRQQGETLWLREIRCQIYEDGTSFEHSIHYHEMACEMAVAYLLLKRKHGDMAPPWLLERTKRMLKFQMDIAGPLDAPPAIGDATEDPLFPLDSLNGRAAGAWQDIYRALFDQDFTPLDAGQRPAQERAWWLLGGLPAISPEPPMKHDHPPCEYPDGGFYTFTDPRAKVRMLFRTGPPPSEKSSIIGGHMHADLLSIYLSMGTTPYIVDAGTYTYRNTGTGDQAPTENWRSYFLGPQAHNGLALQAADPISRVKDDFREKTVESRVRSTIRLFTSTLNWLEAENLGDTAYAGHRRGLVQITDRYSVLYDILPKAASTHRATINFQFSPFVRAESHENNTIETHVDGHRLLLIGCTNLSSPTIYKGHNAPLAGWVSPRYGELVAAPMLQFAPLDGSSPCAVALLYGEKAGRECRLETCHIGSKGLGFKIQNGDYEDYLLLSHDPSQTIDAWGIAFKGSLLWLRLYRSHPIELRSLHASHVIWPSKMISIESHTVISELRIAGTGGRTQITTPTDTAPVISWPAQSSP